ncbi:hypothetical protein QPR39_02520 [Staphylococcus aureus]|nr:hypothetical protein QPR39_02520 [Staphylococcus aureus]
MTTASLNAYNQKLQAARQKLTEINQVLNGNPTSKISMIKWQRQTKLRIN